MKKVILNKCYGGFGVSDAAYELYAQKKELQLYKYISEFDSNDNLIYKKTENTDGLIYYFTKDMGDNVQISNEDYEKYKLYLDRDYREDLTLIEVVEELGEAANTNFSNLIIVQIPEDMTYTIDDYDGRETLHEDVVEY